MNQLKSYIKIARPDHWVKNAFIVPGVIIAELLTGKVFDSGVVIRFIWGFMATCFIASANYVINEWLDAKFDKYHPTKKNRPVVAVSYTHLENTSQKLQDQIINRRMYIRGGQSDDIRVRMSRQGNSKSLIHKYIFMKNEGKHQQAFQNT